jgi:hypothetical protein
VRNSCPVDNFIFLMAAILSELKKLEFSASSLETIKERKEVEIQKLLEHSLLYIAWYDKKDHEETSHGDSSCRAFLRVLSKKYAPSSCWTKSTYMKDYRKTRELELKNCSRLVHPAFQAFPQSLCRICEQGQREYSEQ